MDTTAKNLAEYNRLLNKRREAISQNRSIRMRNLQNRISIPLVDIPVLPASPMRRQVCEPDGTFYGVLTDADEVPPGYIVKMVPAIW